jgi:hypothetical protein
VLHDEARWNSKTELASPLLLQLLERWRDWAKTDSLPMRARFDPIDFPRLLPWVILAEILPEAPRFDARLRYLGSEIVHFFQSENLTGTLVSDLPTPYDQRWSDVGERAMAARGPLFLEGKPYQVDLSFVPFEILVLPLSKTGGSVDFLILALAISHERRVDVAS